VEVRWCQFRAIVPSVHKVHCRARSVWPGITEQQHYSKFGEHLRGLRFQTDEDVQEEVKRWLRLQYASFYQQGFDLSAALVSGSIDTATASKNRLRLCPISDPYVTYCNLFIFEIKKEPYFRAFLRARQDDALFQKTVMFILAVLRTWNITKYAVTVVLATGALKNLRSFLA
jgi:hypothetical protein